MTHPLDPKSWKVGVRVRGSGSMLFNEQRFETREEADAYAKRSLGSVA
jgi:hypothetical protein